MPSWLNDQERSPQFFLAVKRQDPFKLGMNGVLSRRQDAEINDPWSTARNEDEAAEISIARDKQRALLMGDPEQINVLGPSKTKLGNRHDLMPQAS